MLFFLVICANLTAPSNGMINCSMVVPAAGVTCRYTCNTGYELSGSDVGMKGHGMVLLLLHVTKVIYKMLYTL